MPDDVWLTQLGHVKFRQTEKWSRINISFRCGLSENDEGYLSLIEGKLTVAQTVPLVARGDMEGAADCVRHTQAGQLTKAGFEVVFKPTPTVPGHVAVHWDGEWTEQTSEHFDNCFVDYVRGLMT